MVAGEQGRQRAEEQGSENRGEGNCMVAGDRGLRNKGQGIGDRGTAWWQGNREDSGEQGPGNRGQGNCMVAGEQGGQWGTRARE